MKKYIALVGISLFPVVAFAATVAADVTVVGGLSAVADSLAELFNLIIPIMLTIAVFIIIWGVFQFVLNAGDEEARKSGRSKILWGIVGVFLMLSVWGLINILLNTLSLDNSAITSVTIF